jgi:hypothetical protein
LTKQERREAKRRNTRKMRVSGRSVKLIMAVIMRKANGGRVDM